MSRPFSSTLALRILKRGSAGADVNAWQIYLAGEGFFPGHADGKFGTLTETAVIQWQTKNRLTADGVIGPKSWAAAIADDMAAPITGTLPGDDFPARPDLQPLASNRARERAFGAFKYRHTPTPRKDDDPGDPDTITILGDWEKKHIVKVVIPALAHLRGDKPIRLHRKSAPKFEAAFAKIHAAGLSEHILTFDGAFYARFQRGSRTALSNHAWGAAIDINAAYNGLGRTPARRRAVGCLYDLVPIFNAHGIYWGGHFRSRADGMHFEDVG